MSPSRGVQLCVRRTHVSSPPAEWKQRASISRQNCIPPARVLCYPSLRRKGTRYDCTSPLTATIQAYNTKSLISAMLAEPADPLLPCLVLSRTCVLLFKFAKTFYLFMANVTRRTERGKGGTEFLVTGAHWSSSLHSLDTCLHCIIQLANCYSTSGTCSDDIHDVRGYVTLRLAFIITLIARPSVINEWMSEGAKYYFPSCYLISEATTCTCSRRMVTWLKHPASTVDFRM